MMEEIDPEQRAAMLEAAKLAEESGRSPLRSALAALGLGSRASLRALPEAPPPTQENFLSAIREGHFEEALEMRGRKIKSGGAFRLYDSELAQGLSNFLEGFRPSRGRTDEKGRDMAFLSKMKAVRELGGEADYQEVLRSRVRENLRCGEILAAALIMRCGLSRMADFETEVNQESRNVVDFIERENEAGQTENLEIFKGVKLTEIFLWHPVIRKEFEARLADNMRKGHLLEAARLINLTKGYKHVMRVAELERGRSREIEKAKKDGSDPWNLPPAAIQINRAIEHLRSVDIGKLVGENKEVIAKRFSETISLVVNPGGAAEAAAAFCPYMEGHIFTRERVQEAGELIERWIKRNASATLYWLTVNEHLKDGERSEEAEKLIQSAPGRAELGRREFADALLAYGPHLDLSDYLRGEHEGRRWSFEPHASLFEERKKGHGEDEAKEWLKGYFVSELKDPRPPAIEPFFDIEGVR